MSMGPPPVRLCGYDVALKGRALFLLLCCGAIGSAIGFAALQEGVWHVHNYKFSGYMTLWTAATMAACGQLERMVAGDTTRVGSLRNYLKLSLLTLSGMYFTNWSLQYLNYPTRVLFKSSKLVPTMAMGTVMQARTYTALEYIAATGLVAGIVLFTLGDAELRPAFHPVGIGLILVGVAADAATGNFEEREFFRIAKPASQPEVIAYSSLFGTGWAIVALLATDEISEAVEHSLNHPKVIVLLIVSSVCGYISVTFVLLLINLYGATVTEMVKSLRKVLTVVLSFVIYPKPISDKYVVGGACVLLSLVATQQLQWQKGGDVHHAPVSNATDLQPLAGEADTDAEGEQVSNSKV